MPEVRRHANHDAYARALGRTIRVARKQAGMKQLMLAHKAGVDKTTVSKWELGQRMPTINHLMLIADAVQVSQIKILTVAEHAMSLEEHNG